MGRTSKPLRIGVHDSLCNTEEINALSEKGHHVANLGSLEGDPNVYDLLLGPNCWRLTPDQLKHLDLAIKGARELRYPKEAK